MKYFRLTLLFVILSGALYGQDFKKFDKGNFIDGKDSISYRILFPENFDPQKKYPVLFFLHGSGERGSDNEKQLVNGGRLFLQEDIRRQFPAIVIFPQCKENSYWSNVNIVADSAGKRIFEFPKGGKPTQAMKALLGMVDNILDKPYVDPAQVYVGGLSMGGMGTYELLRRKRKTFAAAFAICGGDNVANVRKYKKVPLWIFHGGKDDIVPAVFSTTVANQLKIIGTEVKFTLYPDANHNSWDSAFAEPQLLPWLFGHRLKK